MRDKTLPKSGRIVKEKVPPLAALDGKPPVFLVGVNYDPKKRGIDDPLVEKA